MWAIRNKSDHVAFLRDGTPVKPGKTAQVKPHDLKVLVKSDPATWERV